MIPFRLKSSWIKIVLINCLGVLISLEGVSLGFYGIKTRQLFYQRVEAAKSNEGMVGERKNPGIELDESLLLRLHPYFGYTDFKPQEPTINNYQFGSARDYPVLKEHEQQYIIGIFGGSVAVAIANTEAQNQIIVNTLKTLPQLTNKEIIILNFAQGGYKQPQQLLVLNYFLSLGQTFDMVINIDGFNEVALSSLNYPENVHLSMPNGSLMKALINVGNHQLSQTELEMIVTTREYYTTLGRIQGNQNACWLALCYIIHQFRYVSTQRHYQAFLSQQAENKTENSPLFSPYSNGLSFFYLNPLDGETTGENLYSQITQTWMNSSLLMHQTLGSQNHLYFHFVQPNQYYPTERVFTPEEQKQAINEKQIYAQGVREGYPLLIQAMEQLKNNNVHIFNGVRVFDSVPTGVYSDDCCHYNRTGNQIFAQYIANSIVETLRAKPQGLSAAGALSY